MKRNLALILAVGAMFSMISCDDDSNDDKSASCTNGTIQCSANGIPQKCVNGDWSDQAACVSPTVCSEGACTTPSNNDNGTSGENGSSGENGGNSTPTPDPVCENASSDYICDGSDYVVCDNGFIVSRTICSESSDKSGNLCIEDTYGSHCGCKTDDDCAEGYACGSWGMCEASGGSLPSGCSASKCEAMTGSSYVGNACVTYNTDTPECGCNDNHDCKSGYACGNYNYCEPNEEDDGSCASDSDCKAKTGKNYTGDLCIMLNDSTGYCGCEENKDCHSGVCSELGICE